MSHNRNNNMHKKRKSEEPNPATSEKRRKVRQDTVNALQAANLEQIATELKKQAAELEQEFYIANLITLQHKQEYLNAIQQQKIDQANTDTELGIGDGIQNFSTREEKNVIDTDSEDFKEIEFEQQLREFGYLAETISSTIDFDETEYTQLVEFLEIKIKEEGEKFAKKFLAEINSSLSAPYHSDDPQTLNQRVTTPVNPAENNINNDNLNSGKNKLIKSFPLVQTVFSNSGKKVIPFLTFDPIEKTESKIHHKPIGR